MYLNVVVVLPDASSGVVCVTTVSTASFGISILTSSSRITSLKRCKTFALTGRVGLSARKQSIPLASQLTAFFARVAVVSLALRTPFAPSKITVNRVSDERYQSRSKLDTNRFCSTSM